TAFYGKFAIPHSNIQNANVTKLYIMVNQEGILWDSDNIKLVFLILIKKEAANDFRKLYVGITETLYHSNTVFNNIEKINNVEDLKKYLF
ncbi:MAG: PTS sugar transporter subunit IIA, partial [Traorella sp.]